MQAKTKGLWYSTIAYLLWGILPIYWKWIAEFSSMTLLAHRIIWSFAFTFILLALYKRLSELKQAIFSFKNFTSLLLRSIFVVSNWLIYVWAINSGHILSCSLGYFICPISAVLLGCIFLKEQLTRNQKIAIALVIIAVLNLVINFGSFPWIAISIALTFSIYGILKKTAYVESLPGLSAETALLSIPALLFIFIDGANNNWSMYQDISLTTVLLLIGTGIITATPLLFFAFGVRKIKISTVGILQYISPTCTFLIGIFIYNENFNITQLITYIIIWISIIIYVYDILRSNSLKQ